MWIAAYVVASVVLVAGVAVFALDRVGSDGDGGGDRGATELPVLAPMPFASVVTVDGGGTGPVGTEFQVAATSYGEEPAARVDLYDGGRRVGTATPDPESPNAAVPLTFPALSVGPHALHVEVTDAAGNVSLSPVEQVDVVVAAPPGAVVAVDPAGNPLPGQDVVTEAPDVPVPVVPDEGETLGAFADRLDVDLEQLAVYQPALADEALVPVPDLGPDDTIPPGSEVVAAVRPDAGFDALTSGSALAGGVAGRPVVPDARVMGLAAEADGCGAVLTASSSDGPVTFFDGAAGVAGWAEVGRTDGDGELALPTLSPGAHSFFARTEQLTSATVSVKVPVSCSADTGWTGDAKIVDGRLYLAPAALGPVYLYLQVDGGTGVRIPADPGSQGRAVNAGLVTDIRDLLPDLTQETAARAELEVWRASEFPSMVGQGTLTLPPGLTVADVVGLPGAIDLRAEVPDGAVGISTPQGVTLGHADEDLSFTWEAASSEVDEVLWEVLSGPPTKVAPGGPAVLAAGISDAGAAEDGTGTQGTFGFSTADIPGHEQVGGDDPPLPVESTTAEVVPALVPSGLRLLDGSAFVRPVEGEVPPDISPIIAALPGPGALVYVRVTANPKGPALGTSSNAVTVRLPSPEPPESAETGVRMQIDEMTLDPGRAPNPSYGSCAIIKLPPKYTGDFWEKNPKNAAHLVYTSGNGTYCYAPPPPPEGCLLEDYVPVVGELVCDVAALHEAATDLIVDLVTAVYSGVALVYNGIIDTAVRLAGELNPLCIALDEVDDASSGTCEEVSQAVARAAISAVLAAFGLPPRLPTAEQLMAIAEGELENLAVILMEQAGVPCSAIKADPDVIEAIQTADELGVKIDGVENSDIATVAADPCLAFARFMIKTVRKGVTKLLAQRTAQATGLPDFSYLTGFEMKPEPRSLPVPMTVTVAASPVDPTVDATGMVCDESLLPSAGPEGYPGPFIRYSPIRLTEEAPVDGKGRWVGTGVMSNYLPSSNFAKALTDLDVTVSISMAEDTADHYSYGRCQEGEGSVTERVRPPDG